MSYTHINPGSEIELSSHVYYSDRTSDISDLVTLSLDELGEHEKASVEKEKEIFGKLHAIEVEWAQQARQTIRFRQAQQYLKTPPTEHTANRQVEGEYNWHEISNMVYKMTWRVYENTKYDRAAQRSIPISWEVSWYLSYNTPRNPDDTRSGRQLAGQDRKRFADKAAMEKYLQGRIAHYAHLFTEISPPIPKGEEGRFSINGVLLPGYTVETPEPTPQEVADGLLDFLEDGDMDVSPKSETKQPPREKPTPKPPQKQPKVHKHKKSVPTR